MASAFPIRPGNRREDGRPPDRPMIRAEGTGELVRLPSIDVSRISFAAMGAAPRTFAAPSPRTTSRTTWTAATRIWTEWRLRWEGSSGARRRGSRCGARRRPTRTPRGDWRRRLGRRRGRWRACVSSVGGSRRPASWRSEEKKARRASRTARASRARSPATPTDRRRRPSPTTRSASSATFARGEGGWTSASRGCWRRRRGTTGNERWSRARTPPGTTSSPSPWATASDTGGWRRRRRRARRRRRRRRLRLRPSMETAARGAMGAGGGGGRRRARTRGGGRVAGRDDA